jgi:hypothetical protein
LLSDFCLHPPLHSAEETTIHGREVWGAGRQQLCFQLYLARICRENPGGMCRVPIMQQPNV